MKFSAVILLAVFCLCRGASLPQGRVVGGQPAAVGQFPHMASLQIAANGNHFCGGSIISTRWVLSAAHCTIGRQPADVHVVVGTINRLQGTLHQASQVINHEAYNANLLTNDVSVVEVQTPFIFNDNVRAIGVGSVYVGGGVTATVLLTQFGFNPDEVEPVYESPAAPRPEGVYFDDDDVTDANPGFQGRVVGGTSATSAAQFPYMASLRTAANAHFCGATIIATRTVLSAAHCTVGRGTGAVRVVVGTHLRLSGGVSHAVNRIVNHPSYNANTIAFDVSIVQTSATFTFNNNVQQIAMGTAHVGGGVTAIVSGWGQTSHPGSAPNNLQWAALTTLTNADCRNRHTANNAQFVFDHKMCTFTRNGQGICMGDSGGPLVVGSNVVGIPSWVIACARGFPDVYDRVSSHRNWVISVM
uniref:Putative serine-type enodpeptidase sp chironomus riparius n=1 Tax=Lutzomyia longipalpis TaxID=7200 RepID=A0A1B0GJ77_LUTLO